MAHKTHSIPPKPCILEDDDSCVPEHELSRTSLLPPFERGVRLTTYKRSDQNLLRNGPTTSIAYGTMNPSVLVEMNVSTKIAQRYEAHGLAGFCHHDHT